MTTFTLENGDAAIVVREDGRIETYTPQPIPPLNPNDGLPQQILAIYLCLTLIGTEGKETLVESLIPEAKDLYFSREQGSLPKHSH